jgi:hypothetical protein
MRTVQSWFGSPELWGKVRKLGLGPDAQSTRPACFDPSILSKDPKKFKSLKGYKVWFQMGGLRWKTFSDPAASTLPTFEQNRDGSVCWAKINQSLTRDTPMDASHMYCHKMWIVVLKSWLFILVDRLAAPWKIERQSGQKRIDQFDERWLAVKTSEHGMWLKRSTRCSISLSRYRSIQLCPKTGIYTSNSNLKQLDFLQSHRHWKKKSTQMCWTLVPPKMV